MIDVVKRILVILAPVALLLAACGGGGGGGGGDEARVVDDTASDGGASTTTTLVEDGEMSMEQPELDAPIEPMGDPSQTGQDDGVGADAVMISAGLDVEAFWEQTYPEVYGEPYTALEGGFWTYGPDTAPEDLPPCDDVPAYEDIAQNAFYCPSADLIAWDREALIQPFIDEFGSFAAAIVMAHEFGHAIQGRTGDIDTLPGVVSELQADCFAGAWVARVADGGSDNFEAETDQLDAAVAGLIEIRDAPGSDPDDPAAHGSGFDRVSGFSDGFSDGAARCSTYGEEPPIVTEELFDAGDEAATSGDLPTEELLPDLVADLEDFYTQTFAAEGRTWTPVSEPEFIDPADGLTCGDVELTPEELEFAAFYCIADNTVYLDGVDLLPALEEIGDFAVGSELARQWAFAAQVQLGNDENSEATFLNADCLTGLYAGDIYFELRPNSLQLSPGDLDEAIISFLAFSEGGEEADSGGSIFERSDAFRTGFLGGVADCDAFLG